MLYLRNTTDLQYVIVPLECWNGYDLENGMAGFSIWRATFDGRDIAVVEAGVEYSEFGHYVRLGVVLPEGVANGSYELTLTATAPAALAGGQSYVVQVGDYVAATTEYEKTIEYEQFR